MESSDGELGAPDEDGEYDDDFEEAAAPSATADEERLLRNLRELSFISPEAGAPSSAASDSPARFTSFTWLTNVHKHVENFAKSGIVDLSDRNLIVPEPLECFNTAISPEIAAGIVCLDLSGNTLRGLPSSVLRPLVGLQDLDLSRNGLDHFPTALCQLSALQTLDMSDNALDSLSPSAEAFAGGLPNLEALLLARNQLTRIPPCVARSASLLRLDLSSNRLVHGVTGGGGSGGDGGSSGGDSGIGTDTEPLYGCTQLVELNLDDNGLLWLPRALFSLPLTHLHISGNRLPELPAAIRALSPTLATLGIARNGLRALPSGLGQCTCLESLDATLNRGLVWPPEDVMRRPLPRILEWLRAHPSGAPADSDLEAERAAAAAAASARAAAAAAKAAKAAREAYLAGLAAELLTLRAAHGKREEMLEEARASAALTHRLATRRPNPPTGHAAAKPTDWPRGGQTHRLATWR